LYSVIILSTRKAIKDSFAVEPMV